MGHLQLHFQKCSSWKCRSKKCKNKKFSEALGWSKKSFVRRFENDTFESAFFKSVEIESIVVSAHPHTTYNSTAQFYAQYRTVIFFSQSLRLSTMKKKERKLLQFFSYTIEILIVFLISQIWDIANRNIGRLFLKYFFLLKWYVLV